MPNSLKYLLTNALKALIKFKKLIIEIKEVPVKPRKKITFAHD